ncbi:MAG: tetratricopeptide repeat protein [Bacteroidia bacterium]|nr:tetratricopeptide repeat protein [Bacteroidia bacterium]
MNCLLLLPISVITLAAYSNINDSLENILQKSKADTTICRILNILSWSYKTTDSKKSWDYAKKALLLANKHNLILEQGATFNNMGALYYLVKNLDSAIMNLDKAKVLFQKSGNKNRLSKCMQNIAIVYSDKSDYKTAIEIYESLLKIYIEDKDTAQAAAIYNNIGNSNNLMGNYDKAMQNFLKAVEFYEKTGAKDNLSTTYYNMGALQYYKGSYDKALAYCDQSLKIREEIKNPYGIAYSLILKGAIFQCQGKINEALEVNKKALKIDEELDDKQGIPNLLSNISNLYVVQGKLNDAKEYSMKALKMAKETGIIKIQLNIYNNAGDIEFKLKNYKAAINNYHHTYTLADSTGDKSELKDACKGLALAYSSLGDFKNAYVFLQKHMEIKDTLFNVEKNKQLTEMDTKYQSEKKQKEIVLLNKDKDLQNIMIKKQRMQIFSIAVGFILMLILSSVIFKNYRDKKKANKILKNLNAEILMQKHEIEEKNEELYQQNEEIRTQRDEIEAQRDEISAQRDLVTEQKRHIEHILHEVNQSINYAQRIQATILPDENFLNEHFDSHFILYKPKDKVSGDFYWCALVEGQIVVAVADCTGHGVPGAFMSMLGTSFLREIVQKEYMTDPAVILRKLRKEIIKALKQKGVEGEQKDGMDIALVSINKETKLLHYAGAHNSLYVIASEAQRNEAILHRQIASPPLADRNDDYQLHEVKADKMPIAIYDLMNNFTNHEIQLHQGDMIYMFSDGYIDQFGGPHRKKFLSKNFRELISNISSKSMIEQKEILDTTIENWKTGYEIKYDQTDDITVMGIKIGN